MMMIAMMVMVAMVMLTMMMTTTTTTTMMMMGSRAPSRSRLATSGTVPHGRPGGAGISGVAHP
jgi:hypothetical protein